MKELYIALYSPSSVQKLLDFLKTVYTVKSLIPVIIKPFGAAAQVGIPEAHRIAYKLGKPLIVLPELSDLKGILKCDPLYYLSEEGQEVDFPTLLSGISNKRVALTLSSGEQEPSGKELEGFTTIWLREVPAGVPCTALAGILVYEVSRYLRQY